MSWLGVSWICRPRHRTSSRRPVTWLRAYSPRVMIMGEDFHPESHGAFHKERAWAGSIPALCHILVHIGCLVVSGWHTIEQLVGIIIRLLGQSSLSFEPIHRRNSGMMHLGHSFGLGPHVRMGSSDRPWPNARIGECHRPRTWIRFRRTP